MKEFDTPRRGRPGWLPWVISIVVILVVLVLAAGFVGGVGPLRSLGMSTTSLDAVEYRPTANDSVIQVAVAMPPAGLCRDDDIQVTAFARGNRIEVESTVTRPRNSSCPVGSISGDRRWVDVELDDPLGSRTVIRLPDRTPLSRSTDTSGTS
jgi:hypothetical protein